MREAKGDDDEEMSPHRYCMKIVRRYFNMFHIQMGNTVTHKNNTFVFSDKLQNTHLSWKTLTYTYKQLL